MEGFSFYLLLLFYELTTVHVEQTPGCGQTVFSPHQDLPRVYGALKWPRDP